MRRYAQALSLAMVSALALTSFAAAGATAPRPPTADCATVGAGAHGAAVATLQRAVGATPDGDFGPLTAKAVAAWQHAHKLKPTGAVDPATWKALPRPVAVSACGQAAHGRGLAATCTSLAVGSLGPAVMVVQRAVKVTVDGDFGPMTKAAVVAAQRRLKVPASGAVDAAMWAALGLTGTPVCVAVPMKKAASSKGQHSSHKPAQKPVLPADWPQQQKVRAQVAALAAKLPSVRGKTADPVAKKMLAFARAQIGKPYKWGGVGPKSYDCSGLVLTSYLAAGITTPRVAADQYGVGVAVPLDHVQQGDLLFWAMDVTRPSTIYHVGIYAGSGAVLDAPYTGAYVGTRPLWTGNLLPVAWRPVAALVLPSKPGTTGWTVAQLQQALVRRGAKIAVDGGFGPQTTAAVKSWQSAHKLKPTGVVDTATWLSLG